jgi:PAS domain S-box-containing protein
MLDLVKKWRPTYGTHLRVLLSIAVLACFYVVSQHNYLLFHSVVEIFAVVVACAVFVLFWNTRRYLDNGFFLFIGIACLFAGILDLMHVLTYRGMSVIPGAGGDESIQFKTAGRWIAGLSFLAAPLFLRRKLRLTATLAAYSIVLGLVFWLVLGDVLPDYYSEQGGMTYFEHASRGLTCIVFLAAAAVLASKRKDLDARVFRLFLASLIASAGSELASALSGDFEGFLKVLAHLGEVVSLYLVYTAFIEVGLTRPVEVLFRNLKRNEESLQRQIAERQRAEEEALIFRRFAEASGQGLGMATLQGQILYMNQTLCRMLDEDNLEDVYKKGFPEYYPPEFRERLLNEVLPNVMSGGQWVGELALVSTKGKQTPTIENFFLIRDEEGRPLRLADVITDITERKQMEDDLRKAKNAAEAANVAKSEFLANMSHEIRTPMTSILGYTDLLMDDSRSAADRKTFLTTVRRNGEHLLQLINDILDLSKIEAGKMLMDLGPCHLPSTVADVASMMRPRAEQRGNTLEVCYAGQLPQTIHTDGTKLRQVIVNLLGNAVKFTENGSIRISASFLPQWRAGQSAVRVEVADTGIGIRPEALPRLFQPFTQAEGSTTRKYGGTGLGLAISRQIVTALGGALTVQSAPGEGSTFAVTIPTGDLPGANLLQSPGEVVCEGEAGTRWTPGAGALRGVKVPVNQAQESPSTR